MCTTKPTFAAQRRGAKIREPRTTANPPALPHSATTTGTARAPPPTNPATTRRSARLRGEAASASALPNTTTTTRRGKGGPSPESTNTSSSRPAKQAKKAYPKVCHSIPYPQSRTSSLLDLQLANQR